MMKRFLFFISFVFVPALISARESAKITRLEAEIRVDYMQNHVGGFKINDDSGFKGKYLNFRIDGTIAEGLSYSYRQRFNKPHGNATFFDATDWAVVNWNLGKWTLSGGRQVVGIGGFEYDKAPIDCYFNSEYWNNIACYQFGVSASYAVGSKGDNLMLQFCESPFRRTALNVDNDELFAYNLMWMSTHGFFSSLYSVNMIEYLPGKFINYIALGNRFSFGDFVLELDFMNRAVSADEFFGKDMSVMADLVWHPVDRLKVFAKFSYDVNKSDHIGDLCVVPGTDIIRAGGGIEYFPIKNFKDLRLHLNCCYTDGMASTGVLRPDQTIVDAGLTWRMNFLKLKRKN